jgi:virginiamycin B lyase
MVTEYPTPGGASGAPLEIAVGPNNTLWFLESGTNQLASVSTSNPNPAVYPESLPTPPGVLGITQGPGGMMFFTEHYANEIGMFNPNVPAPPTYFTNGLSTHSGPTGIVYADGFIWFTQAFSDQVGRLDVGSGQITEYNAPLALGQFVSQIILGLDGNLWFTELGGIAAFNPNSPSTAANPNTLNVIATVSLPGGLGESPVALTSGPGNTIWYTELTTPGNTFGVGEISTSSNPPSLVRETPMSAQPIGITTGPDGNIWTAVLGSGATTAGTIDQINPSTGLITEVVPITPTSAVPTPTPEQVIVGPDGRLWFTDSGGAVGVVTITQSSGPPAPTIVSETVVFNQKLNKHNKPMGKKTLAGYMIVFDMAMNSASLSSRSDYQLGMFVTKTVKRKKVRVLTNVPFSATNVTSNSVTLRLAGKPTFPKGGQLKVIASGIESSLGAFMAANAVFTISPGGKGIH